MIRRKYHDPVAADSVYGVGEIEMALRCAGNGYVLGVSANHHFGSWLDKPRVAKAAAEIAQGLDLSAGDGTKGARLHDWAYCELADLDADQYDGERSGLWTRGLSGSQLARGGGCQDAVHRTRQPFGERIQ